MLKAFSTEFAQRLLIEKVFQSGDLIVRSMQRGGELRN
jgi:hypothetical protein